MSSSCCPALRSHSWDTCDSNRKLAGPRISRSNFDCHLVDIMHVFSRLLPSLASAYALQAGSCRSSSASVYLTLHSVRALLCTNPERYLLRPCGLTGFLVDDVHLALLPPPEGEIQWATWLPSKSSVFCTSSASSLWRSEHLDHSLGSLLSVSCALATFCGTA